MRPITDADRIFVLALAHAHLQAGWCQGGAAKDSSGQGTSAVTLDSVSWCLVGALDAASREWADRFESDRDWEESAWMYSHASELLHRESDREGVTLIEYNDSFCRCKQDVLSLIDRAAARIGK